MIFVEIYFFNFLIPFYSQMAELLFYMEELRALLKKYNYVVQRYYVQYLAQFDALVLNDTIQVLAPYSHVRRLNTIVWEPLAVTGSNSVSCCDRTCTCVQRRNRSWWLPLSLLCLLSQSNKVNTTWYPPRDLHWINPAGNQMLVVFFFLLCSGKQSGLWLPGPQTGLV